MKANNVEASMAMSGLINKRIEKIEIKIVEALKNVNIGSNVSSITESILFEIVATILLLFIEV